MGEMKASIRTLSSATKRMTRKDSEKDSERPHYYSQFWLDIAAGRRTIGGPKPDEEGELLDDSQEPIALRRPFRSEPEEDLDEIDEPVGRGERPAVLAHPVADAVSPSLDAIDEPEPDEVPLAVDDMDSLAVNDAVEDADIPDVDFAADEETEDEDEDEEAFEDEDEDEEDEGWVAGRGRKKITPKRPVKQPPPKRAKREPRRGF